MFLLKYKTNLPNIAYVQFSQFLIPEIFKLYLQTKWYILVAIFGTSLNANSGTLLPPDYIPSEFFETGDSGDKNDLFFLSLLRKITTIFFVGHKPNLCITRIISIEMIHPVLQWFFFNEHRREIKKMLRCPT